MYAGYMIHSDDGYIPSEGSNPFNMADSTGHKPGQLLDQNQINNRIKIMILELESREDMNCPEFKGSVSSYGFNIEENNCHTGNIDNRMFFSEINSPSEFVMMGCREDDGANAFQLNRSNTRLARYHPKNSGNIFLYRIMRI